MLSCGDEIAAIDRKMQEMYRKIQGVEGAPGTPKP